MDRLGIIRIKRHDEQRSGSTEGEGGWKTFFARPIVQTEIMGAAENLAESSDSAALFETRPAAAVDRDDAREMA
jgi:hypothetical protein